ncbi:hypothetical protein D0864_16516, partial [Hortaea werneckii]
MLSSSNSSIQQRRKTHRRQQSLEVPILTESLGHRRSHPGRHHPAHRRGISVDQIHTLNARNSPPAISPTGFRHYPQDQGPQDTNPGHRQPDQHFVQATQQPSLAQPGYPAQDFQSHLHQQLNGFSNQPPPPQIDIKPAITPPPLNPHQQAEFAKLQHHMEWYRSTFGSSPQPSQAPFFDNNQLMGNDMSAAQMQMQSLPMHAQPQPQMPQTPVSQGHSRTVPNTPQNHQLSWPSPPPTNAKHSRSQSFQLDVAPMPDSMNGGNNFMPTQYGHQGAFNPETASFASDHGYASSAYSSSAVDPLSPRPQQPGHMPTLFEEPSSPLPGQQLPGNYDQSSILLQATAGAPDFNDPNFDFNGPMPLSPREQLLNNLGPDVPATIVDTGVPAWEVQKYIGELGEKDQKYPCLFPGCNRRFGRKENVRAHIQTHLGDRQFKCNLCEKTFVRQHDLKRHVAIHSDDRPFVCPCGTGFARHDALTRHRQRGMCNGALPGFEKTEEEKPKRGRPKKERPDMETRTDKALKQRMKNKERTLSGGEDQDQQQIAYASSSSGASDRSFPVTPPESSDAFDADAFLNMANGDDQFNMTASAWRGTPPTSPPLAASPTKTVDSVDPTNPNPSFNFDLPINQTQGISPSMLSNRDSPCPSNLPTTSSPQSALPPHATPSSPNADGSFHGGSSPLEADDDLWNGMLPTQPDVIHSFDAFSPPGDSHGSSSAYNYSEHEAPSALFGKE